jgi:predicted dinucleotide-binding enzyme
MNITIIGPGKMGRAIATRALAGVHSVTFVGKTLKSAQKAADEVRAAAKQGAQVSAATLEDVQLGDVVVLALWYGTNIEVAKQLGDNLKGKTVVDIANPVNSTYDGLVTAPDSSSAEDVAKAAGSKTKVVKDAGLRPVDAGPLSRARQIEGMQLLHIVTQRNLGTNYESAIKILS